MSIYENIVMALEGLRLNKMRSFLTMLGIIIGIASVIAILTIGQAMSKSVSEGFDTFNKTMFEVSVAPKENYEWDDLSSKDVITDEDIEVLKEVFKDKIENVIMYVSSKSGKIGEVGAQANVSISPTNEGAQSMNNLKMITGRFLTEDDTIGYRNVCVISDTAAKKYFGSDYSKALGSEIEVTTNSGIYTYTCVGIYKHEVSSLMKMAGQNSDITDLYIPYTVGQRDFENGNSNGYSYLTVTTYDVNQVEETAKDVEDYLNRTKFAENDIAKVSTTTLESQISQITSVMSNVQLAIGGIAAISLLVGGIGVMNILLVSVTERTREIGVRKALGANSMDIRAQFITESIIICIIGGMIGVILGGAMGFFASGLMKMPTLPNLFSILLAAGFSMSIGVFFGYYPANKAAKLNPIDALRYE